MRLSKMFVATGVERGVEWWGRPASAPGGI